jgi:hypothetical protein
MFGFRRTPIAQPAIRWPLSMPLLSFSDKDHFSLADACEGVQIFGATGSGKTSGSGRHLALAYLNAGMGGLVLTAKADELEQFRRYCEATGRLNDLKFMSASGLTFNFLDYELKRSGPGGGLTENLVNLFSEVLSVAERQGGGSGREDEGYWRRASRQLVRNCIDLLMLGRGSVSIPDLYRMVVSLPTSPQQVNDGEWKRQSFAFATLQKADETAKSSMRRRDFELCTDYSLLEFPALSDKTRSIIVSTFTSMIDVFQRSVLRELFCTTTTITPESIADGTILLIDLPVKEFQEVGRLAQVLMKFVFMRAIERRPQAPDMRPVFLWADESHNFTSDYDFQFQTTARSARVCTVYLTQSISNYYATLGADDTGKAGVDSLLGCLNTKVLHANSETVTNNWCAELFGRSRQFFVNANQSRPVDMAAVLMGLDGGAQASSGVSEVMELEVSPRIFNTLLKGGFANGGRIEAIVFQGGRRFRASGKTWLRTTFQQHLQP